MVLTQGIWIMLVTQQSYQLTEISIQDNHRSKRQANQWVLVITEKERRPILKNHKESRQGHQVTRIKNAWSILRLERSVIARTWIGPEKVLDLSNSFVMFREKTIVKRQRHK